MIGISLSSLLSVGAICVASVVVAAAAVRGDDCVVAAAADVGAVLFVVPIVDAVAGRTFRGVSECPNRLSNPKTVCDDPETACDGSENIDDNTKITLDVPRSHKTHSRRTRD